MLSLRVLSRPVPPPRTFHNRMILEQFWNSSTRFAFKGLRHSELRLPNASHYCPAMPWHPRLHLDVHRDTSYSWGRRFLTDGRTIGQWHIDYPELPHRLRQSSLRDTRQCPQLPGIFRMDHIPATSKEMRLAAYDSQA